MRQSQTYRRGRKGETTIDMNSYRTYRLGVANRIYRKRHGNIGQMDAWQLAAIPSFFLWAFRGPINYLKRRKMQRRLMKSNSNKKNGR